MKTGTPMVILGGFLVLLGSAPFWIPGMAPATHKVGALLVVVGMGFFIRSLELRIVELEKGIEALRGKKE